MNDRVHASPFVVQFIILEKESYNFLTLQFDYSYSVDINAVMCDTGVWIIYNKYML